MTRRSTTLLVAAVAVAGCGSSHRAATPPTTTVTTSRVSTSTAATRTASPTTTALPTTTVFAAPGALQAEAASAAAGDIPDNQVFVAYDGLRFSMKYPEGWAQSGSGSRVTFRDKNNIVRVVVTRSPAASAATLRHELVALPGVKVTGIPHALAVAGGPALKATYETTSGPNPVTGKRVTLTVDRYVLARGKLRATVDLGTPVGVDNVDAYRLMIESFRWR